ncbi:MAG: hypothetical protein JRJ58_09245, partial [Deltaproteobacteria bacterium]|nr:hypothetical protein [Deltaproteobacteria bacterium]
RFAGRLRLDPSQQETLEQLTRSIINKLMHAPISRLRDESDREAWLVSLEEARTLFALDDAEALRSQVDTAREAFDPEDESDSWGDS